MVIKSRRRLEKKFLIKKVLTRVFWQLHTQWRGNGELTDLFVNSMAGDDMGEYEDPPAAPSPEGVAAS